VAYARGLKVQAVIVALTGRAQANVAATAVGRENAIIVRQAFAAVAIAAEVVARVQMNAIKVVFTWAAITRLVADGLAPVRGVALSVRVTSLARLDDSADAQRLEVELGLAFGVAGALKTSA